MHKADIIVGYKRDRIYRAMSNPYSDFPVPSLLFKWHSSHRRKASGVLGSPYGVLLADGQARHGV